LREIMHRLDQALERGESSALATVIDREGSSPGKTGAKMLVLPDGSITGTVGGGKMEADVVRTAIQCIRKRRLRIVTFDMNIMNDPDTDMRCGGNMTVLIEPMIPPDPLIIFGGGHVGYAIYSILKGVHFSVTVVDDRRSFASKKRFPEADRVLCCSFDKSFAKMKVNEDTFIVICTRAHKKDEDCLRFALSTPARYVGMLGSKKKGAAFRKKMRSEGISPRRIRDLYSPIGLDIGAITPEEIAVSVAAELVQFRAARIMGG